MSRPLSRRDLFKAAPVAGAAAAVGALALSRRSEATVSTRGVCRFCLLHCGIEVTTRGSEVVRVQGDLQSRTRGFLCQHGYALREVVHNPNRVRSPLIRQGDRLTEASWPAALGLVAERLQAIKEKHGPEALLVQTGWPLVRHPLTGLLHRFCHAFGSPNLASVASLCESSVRMGQALTAGSKYHANPRHAHTLVLWGSNPLRSMPAIGAGVLRCAEENRLVVIDTTRTELARRAVEFLQVRPGTDGALALGLANVLIQERLYDAAFVEAHVGGFEEFAQYASAFSPLRVRELTSVPTEQLLRLARRLAAERPTRILPGLGVEQHESGVQTVRAVVALEALLGSLDESWAKDQLTPPGPHFDAQLLPALYRMATPKPVPPAPRARPLGYHEYPLFEVFNREAQGNLLARAVLHDDPYPVRALMLIASNPFTTAPGAAELRRAADKLELLVAVDPFLSGSARLADVVLPASTFAEAPMVEEMAGGPRRNDDADSSIGQPLAPAQHQSWPDWKIIFELARAMGLGSYFPWSSLKEALAAPHFPFMEDPEHQPRPQIKGTPRFATATGKVELKSTLLEQFGFPPLPEWSAAHDGPNAEWPLLLVSGPRDAAFINSQFREAPSIRRKVPQPVVRLHPSRGFTSGERVRVVSEFGQLELEAAADDAIHPDAVVVPFGWDEINVNLLTTASRLDPLSGFPVVRSTRCRVERISPA